MSLISRDSVLFEEANNCLVESDMERESRKVIIEDIDVLLKEAEIYNAQLKILDYQLLNDPNVDRTRRKDIESNCAKKFRAMMSNLYSVLDHIYFFLYCCFQNNSDISFSRDSILGQPVKHVLKGSKDATRDEQPECKQRRNGWITEQCKKIFGNKCPKHVRYFQENLLQLQAIRQVDKSGKEVRGRDGGVSLLHVVKIQHDGPGNDLQFNPSNVSFEELKSVEKMDDWNDTSIFNLLHFFRNFVVHKCLKLNVSFTEEGYLGFSGEYTLIEKGSWIIVPELSFYVIQGKQSKLQKYYVHPLNEVCDKVLTFVISQRNNLCFDAGGTCSTYPYKIGCDFKKGTITFQENNVPKGECPWMEACNR